MASVTELGHNTSASGSGISVTGLTVSAGDDIVVFVVDMSNNTAVTPTDNGGGNTWTSLGNIGTPTTIYRISAYYCHVTNAFTSVTYSRFSSAKIMRVSRITGLAASPIDVSGLSFVQNGTSAAPATKSSGTLAQADEIVMGFFATVGTPTWTADTGAGYTDLGQITNAAGSGGSLCSEWREVNSTSAVQPDGTLGASGPWAAILATFKVAASGTSYTLSASAGSFSATGSSASVPVSRRLSATSGISAITGVIAGLPVARQFAATAGGVSVAGDTAGLLVGRTISASSASFAVIGDAATLQYSPAGGTAYTLSCAAASFAVTGSAASVPVGRVILGAPVAIAVSGLATTTPVQRVMPASSTTFGIAGATLMLPVGRIVVLSPAAFAITGSLTKLPLARRLSAVSGVYGIVGASATLRSSGDASPANTSRTRSGPPSGLTQADPQSGRTKAGPGSGQTNTSLEG